jgi:hypothetical protein
LAEQIIQQPPQGPMQQTQKHDVALFDCPELIPLLSATSVTRQGPDAKPFRVTVLPENICAVVPPSSKYQTYVVPELTLVEQLALTVQVPQAPLFVTVKQAVGSIAHEAGDTTKAKKTARNIIE